MVRLEEVEDEAFVADQQGPLDEEGDWDTDSDTSSIASDLDDGPADETLSDRIYALKDIVPPHTRRNLSSSFNTTYNWGSWGLQGGLKLAWQVSVSVLLLVTPFALVQQEDMMYAMEEKNQQMQQSANEIMAPGATSTPQQTL